MSHLRRQPMQRQVAIWIFTIFTSATTLMAQDRFADVEISAHKLTDSVYMLTGAGGNLGVSIGDDGVFLIDDQFAPLTDKIRAAIGKLSDQPIRFVVNTHWHGDHTGGNESLGNAGSVIVAHANVRERMSIEQVMKARGRTVPPSPEEALPVITFTEGVEFHFNGDTMHVFHVPHAHTDGDTIIHFEKADVVHMGDVFFSGMYPFIDVDSGGSIQGMLNAVEKVLERCGDKTQIIAGHGPVADKAGLEAYHELLSKVKVAVAAMIDAGKSKEETIATDPLAEFHEKYGQGFMKPAVFTGLLYDDLANPHRFQR